MEQGINLFTASKANNTVLYASKYLILAFEKLKYVRSKLSSNLDNNEIGK